MVVELLLLWRRFNVNFALILWQFSAIFESIFRWLSGPFCVHICVNFALILRAPIMALVSIYCRFGVDIRSILYRFYIWSILSKPPMLLQNGKGAIRNSSIMVIIIISREGKNDTERDQTLREIVQVTNDRHISIFIKFNVHHIAFYLILIRCVFALILRLLNPNFYGNLMSIHSCFCVYFALILTLILRALIMAFVSIYCRLRVGFKSILWQFYIC